MLPLLPIPNIQYPVFSTIDIICYGISEQNNTPILVKISPFTLLVIAGTLSKEADKAAEQVGEALVDLVDKLSKDYTILTINEDEKRK